MTPETMHRLIQKVMWPFQEGLSFSINALVLKPLRLMQLSLRSSLAFTSAFSIILFANRLVNSCCELHIVF